MKTVLTSTTYQSLFLFFLLLVCTTFSNAQSEDLLKRELEGSRVEILIDMPATSAGIDIYADKERPLNFDNYSQRVKANGVSIYTGDIVMITKIRKKKKHIEFQLAGGGYGTFGDESASVNSEYVNKTSREKELDQLVKDKSKSKSELDKLKNELNDLKRSREREQKKINRELEQEREMKQARISEKRLQGGSRFNIRYNYNIGREELKLENLKMALQEYVNFNVGQSGINSNSNSITSSVIQNLSKGISLDQAIQLIGLPSQMNSDTDCGLERTVCKFEKDNQDIEATFVEKILVKYTVSSN